MATIDLIVLGMLKRESLSAYDIQKLVEYRNISKWVKISTPSIYKKVIQLTDKGLIESETIQGENLADKVVYSLTDSGNLELQKLMEEIADSPIRIFLDFNAVIVNMDCIPPEQQKKCIKKIEKNIKIMKSQLEDNRKEKENNENVPAVGLAVLEQQYILIAAIEKWIHTVKKGIGGK